MRGFLVLFLLLAVACNIEARSVRVARSDVDVLSSSFWKSGWEKWVRKIAEGLDKASEIADSVADKAEEAGQSIQEGIERLKIAEKLDDFTEQVQQAGQSIQEGIEGLNIAEKLDVVNGLDIEGHVENFTQNIQKGIDGLNIEEHVNNYTRQIEEGMKELNISVAGQIQEAGQAIQEGIEENLVDLTGHIEKAGKEIQDAFNEWDIENKFNDFSGKVKENFKGVDVLDLKPIKMEEVDIKP